MAGIYNKTNRDKTIVVLVYIPSNISRYMPIRQKYILDNMYKDSLATGLKSNILQPNTIIVLLLIQPTQ